jgi:hypothetical protein
MVCALILPLCGRVIYHPAGIMSMRMSSLQSIRYSTQQTLEYPPLNSARSQTPWRYQMAQIMPVRKVWNCENQRSRCLSRP